MKNTIYRTSSINLLVRSFGSPITLSVPPTCRMKNLKTSKKILFIFTSLKRSIDDSIAFSNSYKQSIYEIYAASNDLQDIFENKESLGRIKTTRLRKYLLSIKLRHLPLLLRMAKLGDVQLSALLLRWAHALLLSANRNKTRYCTLSFLDE